VLFSIILGLAVAQILTGYRGLALARARVTRYGPVLTWPAIVLLIAVQSWWAMFGLREVAAWTFGDFAIVLSQTVLVYLLAGLSLPDFGGEAKVDLRAHYDEHRRLFFGVFLLLLVVSLSKDLVLAGRFPALPNLLFHGVLALGAVVAIVTAKPWYHRLLAPLVLAAFAGYVALLFWR